MRIPRGHESQRLAVKFRPAPEHEQVRLPGLDERTDSRSAHDERMMTRVQAARPIKESKRNRRNAPVGRRARPDAIALVLLLRGSAPAAASSRPGCWPLTPRPLTPRALSTTGARQTERGAVSDARLFRTRGDISVFRLLAAACSLRRVRRDPTSRIFPASRMPGRLFRGSKEVSSRQIANRIPASRRARATKATRFPPATRSAAPTREAPPCPPFSIATPPTPLLPAAIALGRCPTS